MQWSSSAAKEIRSACRNIVKQTTKNIEDDNHAIKENEHSLAGQKVTFKTSDQCTIAMKLKSLKTIERIWTEYKITVSICKQ